MISGHVIYTANAFSQDAELAIGGDPLVALLELITNADDAYASAEGNIVVTISKPNPVTGAIEVSVADHAKGLIPGLLMEKFTVLGGENEQFQEGDTSRGLLGRGAKDVASLGPVTFSTIKDDIFTTLTLNGDGSYIHEHEEGIPATSEHRALLNLDANQNGLTATMQIQSGSIKIKVPTLSELQKKLSTHAQLRDLVQRRNIVIVDKRSTSPDVIVEFDPPPCVELINESIKLPRFGVEVTLVLNRLNTYVPGKVSAYSSHGILIKSGITIYENFGFGQDSHPSMGFISGSVTSSEINSLIRQHDATGDVGGRLVTRDRKGLVKDHAYMIALSKAVQSYLLPILSEIQNENSSYQGQGESLSRALKDAARALQSDVTALMKELEEEVNGQADALQPDLMVIPPQLKLVPDEIASLTIRVKGSSSEPSVTGFLGNSDTPNLVSVSVPVPLIWSPHERLDASVASLKISAGSLVGNGVVNVNVEGKIVSVPVIVAKPTEESADPVTVLAFTTPSARIAPTRNRKLELRAPISDSDNAISVKVSGVDVASYTGEIILKASASGKWSGGFVDVKTSAATGLLNISATSADGAKALATLLIEEGGPTGGLGLDFELVRGKDSSKRVDLYIDGGTLRMNVNTDHSSFAGVFGNFVEAEKMYSNEDSPQARQSLMEVLSRELGEYFTKKQAEKNPMEFTDADLYFSHCQGLSNRFIKVFNAALKA